MDSTGKLSSTEISALSKYITDKVSQKYTVGRDTWF